VRGRINVVQFFADFPSVVLLFYLLLILKVLHWQFVAMLAVFATYRRMYSPDIVMNRFPIRFVGRLIVLKAPPTDAGFDSGREYGRQSRLLERD
jgi:hypothetical protein